MRWLVVLLVLLVLPAAAVAQGGDRAPDGCRPRPRDLPGELRDVPRRGCHRDDGHAPRADRCRGPAPRGHIARAAGPPQR